MAHGVDLVGGNVQPVAPPVLEEQVVPLRLASGAGGPGGADCPSHHAAVAGDAVLVVDDEVARLEVVEERLGVGAPGTRPAVRPAAAGDVALDQHCEPELGEHEAPLEGLDDHPPAALAGPPVPHVGDRVRPPGRALIPALLAEGEAPAPAGAVTDRVVEHREGHALLREGGGEAGGRAPPVGRDHDREPPAQEVAHLAGEAGGVAEHRVPATGLDRGRVGMVGGRYDRPRRRPGAGQQAVERQVETGPLPVGRRPPSLGERRGEGGLLLGQLGGPVAHPPGLDQKHLGIGAHQVEQGVLAVGEPRQPRLHPVEGEALGQSLPLVPPPRLGRHQRRRPGPDLVGGQHLPAREDLDAVDPLRRALVGHRELGEAVDLVAPQVDAHGAVGGRGEHVDDRAPAGHLAAVLDDVLAAVPGGHEPLHESDGVDDIAGVDDQGLDFLDVGAEALKERSHRRDQHCRRPPPVGALALAEPPERP
jgi:hypothetical protein